MKPWPPGRAPLSETSFDIAIIGGGINGVAIARECARAGRRTLLVEQNDFASGTTSRATRIIHGGLRYLEHGEIGLVRESLRERQRLLAERPHLVRPMDFILALPPGRHSSLEIRFGLWLYRRFAHQSRRRIDSLDIDRFVDSNGSTRRLRLFQYDDAQCEFPERLVAEWLNEAGAYGAVTRNHTQVLAVEFGHGMVRGIRIRDLLNGVESKITCTSVINAAGPWVDMVCRASGMDTATPLVGGIRGSHIILDRFPGSPSAAIYSEAHDGRPVFLLPWNGQVLFGTTEVRDSDDPGRVQPDAGEIEYLRAALRSLLPNAQVPAPTQAYAGIRPLPYAPGRNEAAVTRRSFLHDHADDGAKGLVSVIGGKLTTAASLAREVAHKIGIAVEEPRGAAVVETSALEAMISDTARGVSQTSGLPPHAARDLVHRHGPSAAALAQRIADDQRLSRPLFDGSEYLLAEVAFAVEQEQAATLADVLLRRVPVALGASWSDAAAREAANRIGQVLGWTETLVEKELEDFQQERSGFLVRPTAVRSA